LTVQYGRRAEQHQLARIRDRPVRRQGVLAPDEIVMLGNVFEDLLQTLGLVDRQDPMTEMVAKCLIEIATSGIRDTDRLKTLTIEAFIKQQQQQQ
jgi:hypothetical protein